MKPTPPYIDRTSFGQITVDGRTYNHDIYILVDGQVTERDKSLARSLYGGSHTVGPKELEQVCQGGPEVLFIGTGQSGLAELNEESRQYLTHLSIQFEVMTTGEVVDAYNNSKHRKAALIHVTC